MEWALVSWPTLILLGLGLRMAIHLHYGARGPEATDPIHVFLSTASWVLIFLGLIPLIVGGSLSFVGLIVVLLAAATLVEAVIERREAQRRSTCKLLSLLVERGEKLDSSVLLAGHQMSGIAGRAARRLFAALEGGMPLAAAVQRNPGALPREAAAFLSAGQTKEAEASGLSELCRIDRSGLTAVWRACADRIAYLASVLLVLVAIFTFLMIKIVPEYEKIFYDFNLELPRMTQMAVSVSQFFIRYVAVPIAILAPLAVMFAAAVGVCYLCDVRPLQIVSDRLFRGRRVADVLRVLAITTEERQPMATTLARLAYAYPSPLVRRQLANVASAVEAGGDWRGALRDWRFISQAEQALLNTAERVGNLPLALRTIAERKERRTMYRLAAAVQILYPCIIVMLAATIGFYAIALFVPIVHLIQGLAS
jgi:protein transport protein HofC